MKTTTLLVVLAVASLALSGCSGKKKQDVVEDVPPEISNRDIDRIDSLVTEKHPRFFSFPMQQELEPIPLIFNDTIAAGTGLGASEFPNDEGYTDVGGEVVPYDLTQYVPVGQPVEIRIKLKWYGDPGASADMDIYVDVPGTHDAFTPDRFDESMNWNIVTKFRVVNTIHIEGEPLIVGLQVNNGKDLHPDGVRYSLFVELRFAEGVLAPGAAYRVNVPVGATGLIFDSEPVTGDEHIQSEVLVIDPDQILHRHLVHNDIATETLFISISKPGNYVLYSPEMHGGFLRVQTDIPNPTANATLLPLVRTEATVGSAAVLSPAAPGLQLGGTFDAGQTFPLDLVPTVKSTGPAGFTGSLNVTFATAKGYVSSLAVDGYVGSDEGRVGNSVVYGHKRANLGLGPVTWTASGNADVPVGSAMGVDIGYVLVSYQG